MFAFYKRIAPNVPDDLLWHRLRIRAEFGFVVDELAIEEDRIPHDVLFRESARIIANALDDVIRLPEGGALARSTDTRSG